MSIKDDITKANAQLKQGVEEWSVHPVPLWTLLVMFALGVLLAKCT